MQEKKDNSNLSQVRRALQGGMAKDRFANELPVRRILIKDAGSHLIRVLIATATLFVVVMALLFTDPWSRGIAHYVREGVLWMLMIFYGLGGGLPLLDPVFSASRALKESPERQTELPDFLKLIAPAVIGIGSLAVFIICYVNHIT